MHHIIITTVDHQLKSGSGSWTPRVDVEAGSKQRTPFEYQWDPVHRSPEGYETGAGRGPTRTSHQQTSQGQQELVHSQWATASPCSPDRW